VGKIHFLFSGDWHLSRYSNDNIEITSHLPERLDGIKNAMYHMAGYAINNGINSVVIGGDILHGKSIIHAVAQNIMLDFFRNHQKLNFIVIDGNHDLSGKGQNVVSALKSIDNEPNVTRISKPLQIGEIMFVPYSADIMIDSIKKNSAKYLISHFGLDEGMLNSGISIIADITLRDLIGRYKTVLLSHYHKPQEIIKEEIKLYYAGSLTELDWGERGETKRFLLVDTEKDTVESIPSVGFKKHFRFELNSENKTEVVERARQLKEEGHHIHMAQVEELDVSDIREEFQIINKIPKDVTNRGILSNMTVNEKLKRYLEIKGIPNNEWDEYLKIGFEIINDCIGNL